MRPMPGSTALARCSSRRAWSRRADPLISLRSEAGRSPDCQPPRELRLHRQLGGELVADLDLEQVVAPLLPRCRGIRGEGIEPALLVEVDQSGPAARSVGDGDQRAEHSGTEALFLEDRVDRAQVESEPTYALGAALPDHPGNAEPDGGAVHAT